jgi:hypothetical protein
MTSESDHSPKAPVAMPVKPCGKVSRRCWSHRPGGRAEHVPVRVGDHVLEPLGGQLRDALLDRLNF